MAIGWNFPNNNNGDENGIGEAGIETFKGSYFTSLAREICQNSLDARRDFGQSVKIEFTLCDIPRTAIPGIENLTEAIMLCKEYWKHNQKTIRFFEKAEVTAKSRHIRVLKVSDYNTTGLTGSNKSRTSPWQDLVKSSGVSNKEGSLGGSFGIGKSAPFVCSDLRTIFYNTLDIDGLKAHQGVAKLVSFKTTDKHRFFSVRKGEVTQGKGFYGEASDNSAIRDVIQLDGTMRTKVGTDIFIVGFTNDSSWKIELVKSVIEGYLISILQDDLEVQVDDISINSKTIGDLLYQYKEALPLTYNYYEVLTNANAVCITEDFEGLGKLELHVLIQKDFRRKVLMARSNGMKIFDKQNISGSIQFAGVCILKDDGLNEYFRQMENPQHNEWESDRYSDDVKLKKQAEKKKKALFKFVKTKILEIGKATVLDEMDAVGAGEFVPDIDLSEGNEGNQAESIHDAVKEYTEIQKVESVKIEKGAQAIEDLGIRSEDIDFGEEDDAGDLSATEFVHGNGTSGFQTQENTDGKGKYSEDGRLQLEKRVSIKPLKLRVFMFNETEKIYKLSFTPDKSAKDAYVEISISGEQSNTSVEIKMAKASNEFMLIHKKNKIYLGTIEANQTYALFFSIQYNEVCSMGVLVHGYKI